VGFTPGTLEADGRYHVRGLNAHAWPEVYFVGSGWVPFEPTPGRAVPGGEPYTGVPDSELATGSPPLPTVPEVTNTTQAGPGSTSTLPATSPVSTIPGAPGTRQPGAALDVVVKILVPILLVVAPVAVVAEIKRRRRRRRRAGAVRPNDRVLVAWTEAAEALAWTGARRRPAETLTEFARRAPGDAGLAPGSTSSLLALAGLTSVASYAGDDLAAEEADAAVRASSGLVEELHGRASVAARLAHAVDPRPLRTNVGR
jgi:hypothetical protein